MHFLFIITTILVITASSHQKTLIQKNHLLAKCKGSSSGDQVQVFITLSSMSLLKTQDGKLARQLEVNWARRTPQKGDAVAIYNSDPRSETAKALFVANPFEHPAGYVKTSVHLPFLFFDVSNMTQDTCLGFWAGYSDGNGSLLASSCLRTRPFWMEEIAPFLTSQSLNNIMIPGSHDSGSYYCGREMAPVSRYKYAQEEPIFNQLVYGLRYFDLRIGFYNETKEKFFINHNFLRTEHSLDSVMEQVLQFINATSKEIVILDFHNFPIGFKNLQVHHMLIKKIREKLSPLLVPRGGKKYPTFEYLWQNQKRILVSYNKRIDLITREKLIWPGIYRAWGDKQHPKDLKDYFQRFFRKTLPLVMYSSMAELTPNSETIVLHPISGLRLLADLINRNVTRWFRDLYWNKANIVATDYFMGNNIIDVAIESNVLRSYCASFVNTTGHYM